MIDRRDHIAGNIYCEEIEGIHVHKYGAHIFHTSNQKVWEYINQFAEFNNYINSPIAVYKDELYNLPFNMNTFSKMWGIRTPGEAKEMIANRWQNVRLQSQRIWKNRHCLWAVVMFMKIDQRVYRKAVGT